ncbi:MAG: cell division protein [Herbaspirillum sp.]|nr:cell division protein [Herbaspirillum sp.]
MHIFFFDWFGWSILWLSPLVWRLFGKLAGGGPVRQRGAIRLWLGTLVMLVTSSALEAMLFSGHASIGAAVAARLTGVGGAFFAGALLLVLAAASLPWIFRSPQAARSASRPAPRAEKLAPLDIGKFDFKRPMPAPGLSALPVTRRVERKPGRHGDSTPRRPEPWKLSPSAAATHNKNASRPGRWPLPSRQDPAKPAARAEREWAPFESLRPTGPMIARSRAAVPTPQASPPPSFITVRRPAVPTPAPLRPPSMPAPAFTSIPTPKPTPTPAPPTIVLPPARSEAVEAVVLAPTRIAMSETVDTVNDLPPSPAAAASVIPALPLTPAVPVLEAAPAAPPPVFRTNASDPAPAPMPPPAWHCSDAMLPGLDLLDAGNDASVDIPAEQLAETGQLIEQRLKEFKVPVTVLGAYSGPVITRYEVEPALGVRGAQIVNLMKDLSRALGLTSIRVVETIPGKTCMGLELPNARRQMIRLAEIFESDAYRHSDSHLTLALGKDITGMPVVTDLARAPHMLVAGTTGSGKSVAINAMILSLLYKATPEQVRLIMIDPKMLELSVYDGIPHLLAPVVTDMKLAANALSWCVGEMDKRYRLMSALGVRNLAGYNQKIRDGIAAEKYVRNPFSLTPDAPEPLSTLPLIVVVIDELADLMMVAGKKIEELIARLAQKARAAGIHLILATQRPSVDVITGLIKANIPTRVAFQVSSKIDSRTVLDQMGAEALLGHGDMLFLPPGSGYPQRVHGAFVSDQEVHRVVEHLKSFGEPDYEEAILAGPVIEEAQGDMFGGAPDAEADPLYDEAVAFVVRSRRASISAVQRQFRVGYNRAARLVEQMESAGILSAMATNGSRDVLTPPMVE